MRRFRRLLCKVTDCRYWIEPGRDPYCLRCRSEDYWPVRQTLGRLLDDLRYGASWWKPREEDDGIPF